MSRRPGSGWARLRVPAFAASLLLATYAEAFAPAAILDASFNAVPSAVAYPAAFIAAFRTGAAISVINQPRMPSIDTEVGSQVIRLPSGTRVRLFYPANCTDSGSKMAPYCTDGRQTTDGMAGMVGFRQLGLSFLLGHLADASSGCIQDAPMICTARESDLPMLIYSHGYGGNMDMATYFFRTMASKGMVVAAVEHTDGTASSTVLEDGSEKRFNEYYMTGRQQLTRRASELLEAADFLPTELKNMHNATIGTIMLGGHSYGAPSAIMAANGASEPSKIRGVIVHDPALGMGYGMLPPNGAKSRTPTISYVSDEYNLARVRYGDATLHVRGAFHGNFVDAPLWAPALVMRPLSAVIPAAGPADPNHHNQPQPPSPPRQDGAAPTRHHHQYQKHAAMYSYTFDGVNYGDLFSTDRPSSCDYCGREVENGAMKICIECTRVGWCSKECEEAGRGEHKLPCQIISSAQSDILRQDFTPDTSMEGLHMTWCDPPPNFHLLHAAAAAALKPMMDDVQDDVHKSGGGKAFWKREYEGEAAYKPFFEELVEHEGEWMEFFRHEKHSYHCMVTVQILNTLVTVHCKRGAFDDCSRMLVLYFKVLRIYRNACSRRGGTGESYCDGMENRGRLAQFHMNCVLEKYEANISILRNIACHEAKYPEGDGTPYGHSNYLALFSKRTEKRNVTAEEIMAHPRKDVYLYVKFIAESSKFKKFAKKEHKRTKLLVCDHCGKEETGMKQYKICPRCTGTAYCGKTCQSNAWKSHKKVCGKSKKK